MPAIWAKILGTVPAIFKLLKRPLAERTSAQKAGVQQLGPFEKSLSTTIVRLGGNVPDQSLVGETVNRLIGKVVQPEWTKAPSVREWLSKPDVRQSFAVLLSNRLNGQADDLVRLTKPFDIPPTDDRAGKRKERLMDVRPSLVPNTQSAKAV